MAAIFFDIDDTLYDMAWPFVRACRECQPEAMARIDAEALFVCSREHSDVLFYQMLAGEITLEDSYAGRLQLAFEDFGCVLTRDQALHIQDIYAAYQREIKLTETIREMFENLVLVDVPIGILTNGPTEHQRNKVVDLGLLQWIPERRLVISGELDFAKPDHRIFDLAAERVNKPCDECWYVGDTFAMDIQGALDAGWHAIWFNHRKKSAPKDSSAPDFVVTSEAELATCVARIARS